MKPNAAPSGVRSSGIIPGYMLEEMARRNPNEREQLLRTRDITAKLLAEKKAGAKIEAVRATIQPVTAAIMSPRTRRGPTREVWDAMENKGQGANVRYEGLPPTGDADVDLCYELAGLVYEYYREVHGWDSIDGQHGNLVSRVHFRAEPPKPFNSAFWDGDLMTYGSGDGVFFNTFVHRFVSGHEFTHGVNGCKVKLFHWGQTATLSEHIADAFGAFIEMYAQKLSVEQYHWIAVRGIHREGIKSVGLRNMADPGTAFDDPRIGKDRQPNHMSGYVQTSDDDGGAHINNGIPNRALAIFAKAVGGYAWELVAPVWFEARDRMNEKATFASFAFDTMAACNKLGFGKESNKLELAWAAVGVKPAPLH